MKVCPIGVEASGARILKAFVLLAISLRIASLQKVVPVSLLICNAVQLFSAFLFHNLADDSVSSFECFLCPPSKGRFLEKLIVDRTFRYLQKMQLL